MGTGMGTSMRTRGKAPGQNHIVNQLKAPDREIGSLPVETGSPPVETRTLPVGTGNPLIETGYPPIGADSHGMRAEINQMAGMPDMSITVTGIWT